MGHWIEFFKRVFQEWNQDKVTRLAASLSYYTLFSLAPLLVVIIAVMGLILGADVAQQQIVSELGALVGPEGAQLINSLLDNARQLNTNLLAAVLGLVTILLGATGVVGELKDSLNTIWNVAPKPDRGLFVTVRERVMSFSMILGIGFLLLVSLVVSASLAALNTSVRSYFQQWVFVAQVLDIVISVGTVTLLFALLFKFLPDAQVAWRDVWVGALITALLFTLGKYLLGLYLGNSSVATPFGAAGSVVVLLVWVYYAAQILFLGAEITQVYAAEFGAGIRPDSDAVKLSDAARVEQGTRAPLTVPQAQARHVEPSPPPPLYLALPRHTFRARGPFKPLELIRGALGMFLFGGLKKVFSFAASKAPRVS